MASETFRIDIPIRVSDETEPGISKAIKNLSRFDKAVEKTQMQLEKMNQTTYKVVIEAVDRASEVIENIVNKISMILDKAFSFTTEAVDKGTELIKEIRLLLSSFKDVLQIVKTSTSSSSISQKCCDESDQCCCRCCCCNRSEDKKSRNESEPPSNPEQTWIQKLSNVIDTIKGIFTDFKNALSVLRGIGNFLEKNPLKLKGVNSKGLERVSKSLKWAGKNADEILESSVKFAGKNFKRIPLIGNLLGVASSVATIAAAPPEERGKEIAGEIGNWAGSILGGAGAGALIGALGGGPVGVAIGGVIGGIGGAIGGEAFTEWAYDKIGVIAELGGNLRNALSEFADNAGKNIGKFFKDTLPKFILEQLPYALGYVSGVIVKFFTVTLPQNISDLMTFIENFITKRIPEWIQMVRNSFINFFTVSLPTFFSNLFTNIYTFITEEIPKWITDTVDRIRTFVTVTIPEFIEEVWDGVVNFVTERIPEYIKSISETIEGMFSNIVEWLNNVWEGVKSNFTKGYNDGYGKDPKNTPEVDKGSYTNETSSLIGSPSMNVSLNSPFGNRNGNIVDLMGKKIIYENQLRTSTFNATVNELTNDTMEVIPVKTLKDNLSKNDVKVNIEVKAEPKITIENHSESNGENNIIALIRAHIREMTDDIGGVLANNLNDVFTNMPEMEVV